MLQHLSRHGYVVNEGDASSDYFDELYPALGRLAANYSHLEFSLRDFACWLLDIDDLGIIFEGQSVDALIDTCKAMLGQLKQTEDFQLYDYERFEAALVNARRLNILRNLYVHGLWRTPCQRDNECQCEPRSSGSPADSRIFHVSRSRVKKWHQDKVVAVVDVERVADEVLDLAYEIGAAIFDGLVLGMALLATNPPKPVMMHDSDQIVFKAQVRRAQRKTPVSSDEPDHGRSTELGPESR